MLFIGLLFREIGTLISVLGIGLNTKEILFCLISQLPKATVQAAIGGVPLAMGLSCGDSVLTMAVVSIVVNPDDFFSYEDGIYVLGKNYDEFVAAGEPEDYDQYRSWKCLPQSRAWTNWERDVRIRRRCRAAVCRRL